MTTTRFPRDIFVAIATAMIFFAAVLAAPHACANADAAAEESRPNIVFFFIDDMGWNDVSFMGSDFYETPNIDRLARSGMVFDAAYANAPNCAPSRACLMSGQYTPRHGVFTVGDPVRGRDKFRRLIPTPNETVLDDHFITLAEVLQAAGYATATMGKWHLGPDPTTQGFDVNVGGNQAGSPHRGYFSPYRNPNLKDGPEGEYLTDRLTSEACEFVEKHRDEPFFLYLTHYAVHTPIQAKPGMADKYADKPQPHQGRPDYAAMVESVDQGVAKVLATLERLQLTERTIVVFFSDNGGHGAITDNSPLRGSKGMIYEGGIRVPLAIHWPGHTEAGSRCETPVIGLDLYPTLLDMAGVPAPEGYLLDGESLVPLLTQSGTLDRDAIFWHFPCYLQSYLAEQGPFRITPCSALRAGPYKLIEFFEDGRIELYNLEEDIGETNDLVDSMPQKAAQLHARLKAWREMTGAPVPTTPNPKYDAQATWNK